MSGKLSKCLYTAISRKVVGKSARDNIERYCGWFRVFYEERMARQAMDVCLRVLNESNKSRFDSYSVRNSPGGTSAYERGGDARRLA